MAKNRDNRNDVDHTRQTTIRLFEDRDREQRDIVAEIGQTISRNGAWTSSLHSSYTSQLLVISPTAKKVISVLPSAPIKPRKIKPSFSKKNLKPKKLRFTDKEKDETEDENYSHKSADFSMKVSKQKAEFSKQQNESKGRLDRENLSATLQKIRLELDNKENKRYRQKRYEKRAENNHSIAKEHSKNNNDSSQMLKLSSSKDFEKYTIVLSSCKDTWNKKEKLLWLQSQRDVGMWIQCCRKNCKKWRYCDDFHDPVDVPKIWYCKMNSNKTIASCFVPEVLNTKEIEEDFIENKYNAGSLVWGRVDNYTWWPAIVDDCPEMLRFYELEEPSIIPQNRFDRIKYKRSLEEAYALAQSAIPLSIFERLQRFSYISRLRNLQASGIQPYEEQNGEISCTPTKSTKHITLNEFYFKNKYYTKNKFL